RQGLQPEVRRARQGARERTVRDRRGEAVEQVAGRPPAEIAQAALPIEVGAVLAALPPGDGALGYPHQQRHADLGQSMPQAIALDQSAPAVSQQRKPPHRARTPLYVENYWQTLLDVEMSLTLPVLPYRDVFQA